jgi:formylglycine-generating enzyme required for sulfatase activity
MSGNVFEWCWDKYDADFYETSPEVNPINTEGSQDLFRGGDINYRSGKSTVYYRAFYTSADMLGYLGIRLAVGK